MKKCETRERLLETAIELIWTESYGSVGVEEICRKSKIQKGSFYHFFPSKVDLAVAALGEAWQKHKPNLDRIFSKEKSPMERLMDYVEESVKMQESLKERFGFFPGCPFTSIGMERGGGEELLRVTAAKHFDLMEQYFVETVRDAVLEGTVKVKNPARSANEIFSLYLGAFTRLRITGDIEILRSLKRGMRLLLGLGESAAAGSANKKKRLYPNPRRRARAQAEF